jgi:hypothetical protein
MRVSELLVLKFHILLKIELNEAGLPNRPQAELPQMTATMGKTAAVIIPMNLAPAMRILSPKAAREKTSQTKVRVRIVIKLHSTRNAS